MIKHDIADVEILGVSKSYGGSLALDNVNLTVPKGELLSLLGPSGCGKTTLLRSIAGLLEPNQGSIRISGREVVGVPPHQRNIGFVFQNYALFPHMSVRQNVAFGLRMRRRPTAQISSAVDDALSVVQLAHLADRYPSQLSGGQQQRVALARSIVLQPTVLLLDEPFAALDRSLRDQMQMELRSLQRRLGITTIFVTHDQDEALRISDRIAVMRAGVVEQIAAPQVLYEQPCSPFVLGFMGQSNQIKGKVTSVGESTVTVESGQITFDAQVDPSLYRLNNVVMAAIRPERLSIADVMPSAKHNILTAHLSDAIFVGNSIEFHLAVPSLPDPIVVQRQSDVETTRLANLGSNKKMWISWEPSDTMLFPDDAGGRA